MRSNSSMPRRTFFTALAASVSGILVGPFLLRGVFSARRRQTPKITVVRNPLAVPRTKKGPSANG